jgi:hypothetical protein
MTFQGGMITRDPLDMGCSMENRKHKQDSVIDLQSREDYGVHVYTLRRPGFVVGKVHLAFRFAVHHIGTMFFFFIHRNGGQKSLGRHQVKKKGVFTIVNGVATLHVPIVRGQTISERDKHRHPPRTYKIIPLVQDRVFLQEKIESCQGE